MTHEILEAKGLADNIAQLLREHRDALEGAMGAALGKPPHYLLDDTLRVAAGRLAEQLAARKLASQLARGGRRAAEAVLKLAARLDGATFYASSLGRAVAWWIGVPAPQMPDGVPAPSLVGAALGVTRQRAQELQRLGRCTTPAQVADEMQRRWPRG